MFKIKFSGYKPETCLKLYYLMNVRVILFKVKDESRRWTLEAVKAKMGTFCFRPLLLSESWNDHQHFLVGGHFRLATASEMLVVEYGRSRKSLSKPCTS